MASTNKTENYSLSQWVEDDPVLREDFNSDNLKIDATLKSLRSLISQTKLVTSSYYGNGTKRTILTSYTFSAVIIFPPNLNGENTMPEMATQNNPSRSITLLPKGLTVEETLNRAITTPEPAGKFNTYRVVCFV